MKLFDNYVCSKCSAKGVRLWRMYSSSHIKLLCTACTEKEQNRKHNARRYPHCIGGFVPAIPTKENDGYWGYYAVPKEGVEWWDNLPIKESLKKRLVMVLFGEKY